MGPAEAKPNREEPPTSHVSIGLDSFTSNHQSFGSLIHQRNCHIARISHSAAPSGARILSKPSFPHYKIQDTQISKQSPTMAQELAIAKAALSASLFRADPTSLSRPQVEALFPLIDAAVKQCSRPNVQVCPPIFCLKPSHCPRCVWPGALNRAQKISLGDEINRIAKTGLSTTSPSPAPGSRPWGDISLHYQRV